MKSEFIENLTTITKLETNFKIDIGNKRNSRKITKQIEKL